MKTLFSFLTIAVLVLTSSFTVANQQEANVNKAFSCFNYLRVHRQGKNDVAINWAVNSPQISMFILERSYDGDFFDNVSTVAANGASVYRQQDKDIYPGVIYYRVVAVYNNGSTECSPVESIRIVQRK
jgi:hypothetical protein